MNILRNPIRSNLRLQLILALTVLILLAVGLVVLQILPAWQSDIEDNVEETEAQFIALESLQIQGFVNNLEQDIRFLSGLASVQELAELLIQSNPNPQALAQQRARVEQDFLAFSGARRLYNQVDFLDATGFEVVQIAFDGQTANVLPQSQLTSKDDREYFILTAAQPVGGIFVSRLELTREGSPPTLEGTLTDGTAVPTLRYGVPIYVERAGGETPVLAGVVVTNLLAQNLLDLLQISATDATAFLIDENGYYLKNSENPLLTFGFEPDIETIGGTAGARIQDRFSEDAVTNFLGALELSSFSENDQLVYFTRIQPPGANYFWVLGDIRDESVVLQPIADATNRVVRTTLVVLVVLVIIGAISVQYGIRPLLELTQVAEQVAAGNRSIRSRYANRSDEIGTLSRSLNAMTTELDAALTDLESRIESATHDLQTLIDVNLQTASLLESNRLLQAVASLTKERFEVYHAQFYLLDGDQLKLAAGAGFVGRQMLASQHQIALKNARSIVAKAARDQKTILTSDTTTSPNFLPNPLLPNTISELAIPLIARNQFIGIMDLQSDRSGLFTERFIAILEVLALQLSNAILNARLFESATRESRHDLALNQIAEAVQSANTLDDVLKTAARELGRALRVPHTVIEVQLKDTDS